MKVCPDLQIAVSLTNEKISVAELMDVQHVLEFSYSFLLNNSLSLFVEQQQFISFQLKLAVWKHTILVWFSYFQLNEDGGEGEES